ncbi:unnamed protein product [Cyprideis torosa]|uniref:Uncharacterized protein n=1 Tax=Cyprideis torosa TaxID=163714 RepID=A0A7R8WPB2_9CRUS|nr:unnamed protein product [Cyprideis torosa]CAG0906784.1 unnamed protein product [Cyprideis torosa]
MTQEEDFCPGKALTGRCISLSICYRIRAINEDFFPVRECQPSESTRRVCCALRPRERSSLAIAKRKLMDDMVKDCYKTWPPGKIVNGKELPNAFYYPFLDTVLELTVASTNVFHVTMSDDKLKVKLNSIERMDHRVFFSADGEIRFDIIRLREHNVKESEPDLPPPVDIPIAEQIVHPDYHFPSHENDIALLRRICNPSEAL